MNRSLAARARRISLTLIACGAWLLHGGIAGAQTPAPTPPSLPPLPAPGAAIPVAPTPGAGPVLPGPSAPIVKFRPAGPIPPAAFAQAQGATPVPVATPAAAPIAALPQPMPPNILSWDADTKNFQAMPNAMAANFVFSVTNISTEEVVITAVRPSCGCTVAKMPSQPWKLAPGESGQVGFTVDLRGKSGTLMKSATVDSTRGYKMLNMRLEVPGMLTPTVAANPMADRTKNQQLAFADRQAVFHGDCARCHADPAAGKTGEVLYAAACTVCHDSANRASMVPDLHSLAHVNDREAWRQWITYGKTGSIMPGFSQSVGGPLTEQQINSLADFLATSALFNRVAAQKPRAQVISPVLR